MPLVDVHAHFLPPVYREALATRGIDRPDGMPAVPDWAAETHLGVMDQFGIDTAVLSISSPGVHLDSASIDDTVQLATAVNDAAAATVGDHPGRFGAFASLPLPSVDAALAEAERALDHLRLGGVNLLTNVDGLYLADPLLESLLGELDRRAAVVFVHPTSPTCWAEVSRGYARPMLEFPFESTRAITDLALSGALDRHANIQWIVPHAGGALPFLAHRVAAMAAMVGRRGNEVLAALGRLHYDLAGSANSTSVAALLDIVDASQVLYGSDWPFTPEPGVARGLDWVRSAANPVPVGDLGDNAARLLSMLD